MSEIKKVPKLSIVIPVHNVEKYIKECIDSFLVQEFKDYELLLIENGSTDNSAGICDEIAKTDERIRAVHKKKSGLPYARNVGLREAKGEYIFFYDSDDVLPGECLKEIMDKVESEKTEFMICNYCTFIDGEDQVTQGEFDVDEEKMKLGGISALNEFFKYKKVMWSACRVISLREFIIKNELFFNESYNSVEDGDFFFRAVLNANRIGVSKTNLLMYRLKRKNSITNTVSLKIMTSIFEVYTKWQKFFCEVYSKKQAECILSAMSNALYYIMFSLLNANEKDRKELYRLCRKNIDSLKYVSGIKKKIMYYIYKFFGIRFGLLIVKRAVKG